MARSVFYSFHYIPDNWRAGQVRNIGAVEGNKPASDNDWESITGGGEKKIEDWINDQMYGRSCAVVLIGEHTAGRKWINFEIRKAWEKQKGLVGIYVHGLKNAKDEQATKGKNPFEQISVDGKKLSEIVKAYDPPFKTSPYVYDNIKENIEEWIEEAIKIRSGN
jgi:hypothetical protein